MRRKAQQLLMRAWRWVTPRPDPIPMLQGENRALSQALATTQAREAAQRDEAHRFLAEMVEAQAMCGAGPWAPGDVDAYASASKPLREALQLREAGPVGDTQGAYGMYELMLQNVNWQREINYSWLEFSRWGIQQIILICRLYSLKNPIVRRLVDVCAQYVFARGVDVSTDDDAANEVLESFFERNRKVIGHVAMMELEKSKDRDGNLFFAFFTDPATGEVDLRMIDATEMQDIWCDPEDSDTPWYYLRQWTARVRSVDGSQSTETHSAWYPAINFDPPTKPQTIGAYPVMWGSPVYHRKVGTVGKWLFGCPRIYPMLDWAKEARRFLEACASVRQSLSQFAFDITTKGGQQAIEGVKQQMQTQVGPAAQAWDTNPPAVAGASFIHGGGISLDAFKVQGATFSPEDVRRYTLMCCMVKGVPETFLGDVSTGNLATATSLDRPTETVMLSLQEEWIEDLTVIAQYVLTRSLRASGGKLREACVAPGAVTIRGAARQCGKYVEADQKSTDIEIRVNFPAIREGDIPALVAATTAAMTAGIDRREGVRLLYDQLGVENGDALVEEQFPDASYDPVWKPAPSPVVGAPGEPPPDPGVKGAVKEAFSRLSEAVGNILE